MPQVEQPLAGNLRLPEPTGSEKSTSQSRGASSWWRCGHHGDTFSEKRELPRPRPETWSVDKPLGRGDSFSSWKKASCLPLFQMVSWPRNISGTPHLLFSSLGSSLRPPHPGWDNSLSSGPLPNPRSTSRGSVGWLPCQWRKFRDASGTVPAEDERVPSTKIPTPGS